MKAGIEVWYSQEHKMIRKHSCLSPTSFSCPHKEMQTGRTLTIGMLPMDKNSSWETVALSRLEETAYKTTKIYISCLIINFGWDPWFAPEFYCCKQVGLSKDIKKWTNEEKKNLIEIWGQKKKKKEREKYWLKSTDTSCHWVLSPKYSISIYLVLQASEFLSSLEAFSIS